jgi:hypothetical protein
VGALLAGFSLVAACGGSSNNSSGNSSNPTAVPDIQTIKCPDSSTPTTPEPSSLPELAKLAKLARKESTPLAGPVVHGAHTLGGVEPPISLDRATTAALAREITISVDAGCRLRTTADAARAGYVKEAAYEDGVGSHWTNWSLVDKPFDPARPSMLLYAPHNGTDELVAFSYWLRSDGSDGPAGYSGNADHWHRHFGQCFDDHGILKAEQVQPSACKGHWINGKDIWMLHAWIVPGKANAWGLFATANPTLCKRPCPASHDAWSRNQASRHE